jgi:hypothetical protein
MLNDEDGPIVVARRGSSGNQESRVEFSMDVGSRRLGHIALWPLEGDKLSKSQPVIEELHRPVILAYDNIALLRNIASRAVEGESTRLARDLHDDFGAKRPPH